jgi:hypothetical protein
MKARRRQPKAAAQAKAIQGSMAKIGAQVVTYSLIALVLIHFMSQI